MRPVAGQVGAASRLLCQSLFWPGHGSPTACCPVAGLCVGVAAHCIPISENANRNLLLALFCRLRKGLTTRLAGHTLVAIPEFCLEVLMKTGHAIILAAGAVIAALVFGLLFYSARTAEDTIAVVGSATKRFTSDIVKWRITLSRDTGLTDVESGYPLIREDLAFLKRLLADKQIDEGDITVQPINMISRYGREGAVVGYQLMQSVFVITAKMDAIEDLALNPSVLTEKGAVLQNSSLEYFYSKLADIKAELLSEAAKDARRRAEEMARNSNVSVGKVTSLRTGVFQITEPFSTEVSDYGMYNTQTKQKDITVTVRATFEIH